MWDAALCAVLASHFGKRTKNAPALRQLENDIKAMRVRVSPRLLAALVVGYAHAQDFPSAWRLYVGSHSMWTSCLHALFLLSCTTHLVSSHTTHAHTLFATVGQRTLDFAHRYGSAKAAGAYDDGLHPPFIALLARAGRLDEMERAFGDVPRARYPQLEALVGTMQKAYIAAGQADRSLALQERVRKTLAELPQATGVPRTRA